MRCELWKTSRNRIQCPQVKKCGKFNILPILRRTSNRKHVENWIFFHAYECGFVRWVQRSLKQYAWTRTINNKFGGFAELGGGGMGGGSKREFAWRWLGSRAEQTRSVSGALCCEQRTLLSYVSICQMGICTNAILFKSRMSSKLTVNCSLLRNIGISVGAIGKYISEG